jgi:NhaP-type Na+/H+ or K+/H+ antiporter
VAESLSVIIDGESLLNDGVAILLYEIFKELLQEEGDVGGALELTGRITKKFLKIALGGPIFGFLMAKVAIFCLARIFNDA